MLQNPNGRECGPLIKGLHDFYFNNFIEDFVVFCHKKNKFCPFPSFFALQNCKYNFSREIVFDNYQFSDRKQE